MGKYFGSNKEQYLKILHHFASLTLFFPKIKNQPNLVGENDLPVAWEYNPWLEPEQNINLQNVKVDSWSAVVDRVQWKK